MRMSAEVERGVAASSPDWRLLHYQKRGAFYECKYCGKFYAGQRNRGWMYEHLRKKHWERGSFR